VDLPITLARKDQSGPDIVDTIRDIDEDGQVNLQAEAWAIRDEVMAKRDPGGSLQNYYVYVGGKDRACLPEEYLFNLIRQEDPSFPLLSLSSSSSQAIQKIVTAHPDRHNGDDVIDPWEAGRLLDFLEDGHFDPVLDVREGNKRLKDPLGPIDYIQAYEELRKHFRVPDLQAATLQGDISYNALVIGAYDLLTDPDLKSSLFSEIQKVAETRPFIFRQAFDAFYAANSFLRDSAVQKTILELYESACRDPESTESISDEVDRLGALADQGERRWEYQKKFRSEALSLVQDKGARLLLPFLIRELNREDPSLKRTAVDYLLCLLVERGEISGPLWKALSEWRAQKKSNLSLAYQFMAEREECDPEILENKARETTDQLSREDKSLLTSLLLNAVPWEWPKESDNAYYEERNRWALIGALLENREAFTLLVLTALLESDHHEPLNILYHSFSSARLHFIPKDHPEMVPRLEKAFENFLGKEERSLAEYFILGKLKLHGSRGPKKIQVSSSRPHMPYQSYYNASILGHGVGTGYSYGIDLFRFYLNFVASDEQRRILDKHRSRMKDYQDMFYLDLGAGVSVYPESHLGRRTRNAGSDEEVLVPEIRLETSFFRFLSFRMSTGPLISFPRDEQDHVGAQVTISHSLDLGPFSLEGGYRYLFDGGESARESYFGAGLRWGF